MRAFHRLKQTLSVTVDTLLDQVEDHEAIAIATLRAVDQGASRVRAQVRSCERRIADALERVEAGERERALWEQRARGLSHDRPRALECVKRMRSVAESLREVARQLDAERALMLTLKEDERGIEGKLEELRRRRATLSSRAARADAASVYGAESIDELFDRWESKIEVREGAREPFGTRTDSFGRALEREEATAADNQLLDAILSGESAQ